MSRVNVSLSLDSELARLLEDAQARDMVAAVVTALLMKRIPVSLLQMAIYDVEQDMLSQGHSEADIASYMTGVRSLVETRELKDRAGKMLNLRKKPLSTK